MILFAAIDILGGKAVRLTQGAFDARTDYDADPLDAATRWVDAGARALHVVDLDGARSGEPTNLEHVRRIAAAVEVDDVQRPGSGAHPAFGGHEWVGVVLGAGVEGSLGQPDGLALEDVDGGKQDHAGATGAVRRHTATNAPSMSSPCAEDFSG